MKFVDKYGYDDLMADIRINYATTHARNADSENKMWPRIQGSHIFKLIELLQER